MSFAERAGFVTGAGSGIGRATALRLARAGGFVAVADVDRAGGERTVELIRAGGGDAAFFACDVTRSTDVQRVVEGVLHARGRLDFAHNNAGVPPSLHAIDDVPEEVFDRVLAVNLKGVWLCMKHSLPVMCRQRSGAIVNTASVCGMRAASMTSPYNAAKHGVIGLTKEAAVEVAARGVRVNAVCPGYVTTPMSESTTTPEAWAAMAGTVPTGRVADPEEIAEVVVWLLSDAASYVTAHSLVADGGLIQAMPGPRDVGARESLATRPGERAVGLDELDSDSVRVRDIDGPPAGERPGRDLDQLADERDACG
jgi:NAD(P)-dependent dehydrogenase (short-subunit alcohol dehydrogenase family)